MCVLTEILLGLPVPGVSRTVVHGASPTLVPGRAVDSFLLFLIFFNSTLFGITQMYFAGIANGRVVVGDCAFCTVLGP